MAFTQKRLAGPAQLTASSAVYYTVPQSTSTIVKQIVLANTTAAAKTVTVRLKTANVAETSADDILSSMTIGANETVAFNCSLVMNNNGSAPSATTSDQLTALASSATSVNMAVFGVEEA